MNKLNGNLYIGSSANIEARIKGHVSRLGLNNHHSKHLQNAWNLYGKDNFIFSIRIVCDEENLLLFEQRFIDYYKPEYNISPTAGRTSGVIRDSEYRKKQSVSQSGKTISKETRRKISDGMKGKKNSLGVHHNVSDETIKKIRSKLIGHPVSDDTRRLISEKNRGYKHTEDAKKKIGLASMGNKYASRKQTEEEKRKRGNALIEYWKRKREIENASS